MMSLLVTVFNLLICLANIFAVEHVKSMYDDIREIMIDNDFLYNRCIDIINKLSEVESAET